MKACPGSSQSMGAGADMSAPDAGDMAVLTIQRQRALHTAPTKPDKRRSMEAINRAGDLAGLWLWCAARSAMQRPTSSGEGGLTPLHVRAGQWHHVFIARSRPAEYGLMSPWTLD